MDLQLRRPLSVLLAWMCLLVPLHAHGGIYKGPNDAGGSSGGSGGNSAPPAGAGGASKAGAGTPGTSTASRGTTTGSGGGRISGGGTSAITGGMEFESAYESWEFWWEANKDSFLDLRSRLSASAGATSGASVFTGRGVHAAAGDVRRPTHEQIHGRVVPLLQELLASSTERDILDSSIMALARAGDRSSRSDVVSLAAGLLGHQDLSVQSAAALALGVAGRQEAVPLLQALMAGSAEGRRLMGGSAVPALVRGFATLSLGLMGDAGSVPLLIDLAGNTKDSERDVKVAAIVALGLMGEEAKGPASRWLLGRLEDEKLDAIIASYVPISLGRLGDPVAVEPLLKAFLSRDTDALVRQSAAIALGQLATLGSPDVFDALLAYVKEGRDQQTRHFSFISLAQIAARDVGQGEESPRLAQLVKLLGDELSRPSSAGHRSWAALACAILGRADEACCEAFRPRLADAWENEKDPSMKSAFALSLGLLGVKPMGAALFEDFREARDPAHRGYTALALGFLEHREAADALRAQCSARSGVPSYRLQVATALGLLGDAQAVDTLVATLQDSETLGVSSAVARALGLIGDGAAIDPLCALAADGDKPVITRAFACVALGRLCEFADLPWNARLAANNNYRARVPAMDEVLDIQ
jgi:HEAT repeat protein